MAGRGQKFAARTGKGVCMCVLQVHCGHEAIVACSECTKNAMGQNFCSCPLRCPVPYACESCIVVEVIGAMESVEGAVGSVGAKMRNEKCEKSSRKPVGS